MVRFSPWGTFELPPFPSSLHFQTSGRWTLMVTSFVPVVPLLPI